MKVGAAIYSMLKDDSAVSALVGTRIYPELAEEGAATPYVVYSVVSNTPVDTKDSAPVDEAQLEVFSVADTYAAANDLADKVRAALSRQGKVVIDTVTVQSVKYTNEVTEVSAERNLFISVQDYTVRTTPVVPSLLLDTYSGAVAAYSLRKVRAAYTGNCIQVQRQSDDAVLDINFDNAGGINIVALENFCAGTNGRIRRWYDQSGQGNDLVQTTEANQAPIVTSGSVIKDGDGHVYAECAAANYVSPVSIAQPFTAFAVAKVLAYGRLTFGNVLWSPNDTNQRFIAGSTLTGTQNVNFDVQNLFVVKADGSDSEIRLNGAADATGTLATSGIDTSTEIFTQPDPAQSGARQAYEFIVFSSDQSANYTGIESNINTHYSIY